MSETVEQHEVKLTHREQDLAACIQGEEAVTSTAPEECTEV